jgi:hypothetical protein
MLLPLIGVVGLLLQQLGLPPQSMPVPSGTSGIEGRVTTTEGQPIEGVTIEIRFMDGTRGSSTTLSDRDGRYSFTGIAAGPYLFTATRRGYVRGPKLEKPFTGMTVTPGLISVTTRANEIRRDMNIRLFRGAVISGRVTDSLGNVVPRTMIAAQSSGGAMIALPANDRGEFELSVAPGDVVVSASALMGADGVEYMMTYYPGVTSRPEAAALRLSAGDVATGLDFILHANPTLTLRGRVTSTRGEAVANAQVSFAATGSLLRSTRSSADGTFTFTRLKPGRSIVSARMTTTEGIEAGWHSVTIEDSRNSVDVVLGSLGSVHGRIATDSGDVMDFRGLRVGAALTDDDNEVDPVLAEVADVAPDGSFAIANVYGPRRLQVAGLRGGWKVMRVLAGGAETNGPHVIVTSGVTIENVTIVIGREQ